MSHLDLSSCSERISTQLLLSSVAALSCHPDVVCSGGLIPEYSVDGYHMGLWCSVAQTASHPQVSGRGRNLDPPVADEAFRYASLKW